MEVKKDRAADLERWRPVVMGVALLVVVAIGVVALEWSGDGGGPSPFDDTMSDLLPDIELAPIRQDDMVPMEMPKPPKAPDPTEVSVEAESELIAEEIAEASEGEGEDGEAETIEPEPEQPQQTLLRPEPGRLRIVEDLPQFPGGASELMKWLTKNLRYPDRAQKRGIEGKVVVQFIVNTDGSLSDIEIAKAADPMLNREALRVMRLMPQWTPGVKNDEPCRTMVSIPIVFKL